jgi:peptide/nickel transport system permease protein/oligopeptide transport system permease protein
MFGQVVYGARASLTVGVGAVMISLLIGVVLGAIAAHYGRLTDAAIMRVTDAFLVFPVILVYVLVAGLLDMRGVLPVMLALGLFGWPGFARIFRGSVLTVKERDYVDAGRAMGASNKRLMFRHITPNAVSPILVLGTMTIGAAILAESALSYLGIGIQHPAISWGDMISSGRPLMTSAPALVVFPGAAIVGTVLAFTLLGDGIRDALDVKMKA